MAATTTQQIPPQALLNQMITGSWLTQAIYVAAESGIADLVHQAPGTSAALAAQAGVNADALQRILRALASVGIFHEDAGGKFEQTPLSELLRKDVPGSMRAWARIAGSEWQWDLLGDLLT